MKNVLILSTTEGHASIAEAASEVLAQQGYQVRVESYEDLAIHLYRWFYRYFPQAVKVYYHWIRLPGVEAAISQYARRSHRQAFFHGVNGFNPDMIVSTSYGYEALICEWRKMHPAGYLNIMVDPRTFFILNLSENADTNCVFDQKIIEECLQVKPKAKTTVTGWFVRERFEAKYSQTKVRKGLGLDHKKFTMLIVSGSEGEMKSAQIIPHLLDHTDVQVVVACGSNQELFQKMNALKASLTSDSTSTLTVLPFITNVHQYMQAADIVVGKAGPNMLFETVATGTPFFALTHVSGQEDGNLEIILEKKLGYVEENTPKAVTLLRQIIATPEMLSEFKEPIQKMAEYNLQSKQHLLSLVEDFTSPAAVLAHQSQ